MAKITKHGKKRMKERANLQSKGQIKKNVAHALKFGIKHNDAKDNLRKWMDKIYLRYRIADDMRIYNEFLYIFKNGKMLTMYSIPENLANNIEKYVDKDIYAKYKKMDTISKRHKNEKQEKKLKEKQQKFHEEILLYDITEFIKMKSLKIKITGVSISETIYTIRYIPYDINIPAPVEIIDYIKDTTGKTVILKHTRDQNGQLMYAYKQKSEDTENEKLVYSTIFDEFKI